MTAEPKPVPIWNPANAVTLSRVPLGLAFLFAYGAGAPTGSGPLLALACAFAVTVELTDMTDGMIARRFRCVTDFGKLVDPFADAFARVLIAFALAGTAYRGGEPLVPLWMPAAMLLRDNAVAFLRSAAAAKGVVVAARASGKWKALVQGPALIAIALLALLHPEAARAYAAWILLPAIVVTLYSLVDYTLAHRDAL